MKLLHSVSRLNEYQYRAKKQYSAAQYSAVQDKIQYIVYCIHTIIHSLQCKAAQDKREYMYTCILYIHSIHFKAVPQHGAAAAHRG